MSEKTALITGVTGQDGAHLADLLLEKGYVVHGIKRRSSSFNTPRVDHLYQGRHSENVRIFLHYGDVTNPTNIIRLVQETQPDEIYNLGAQSHLTPFGLWYFWAECRLNQFADIPIMIGHS